MRLDISTFALNFVLTISLFKKKKEVLKGTAKIHNFVWNFEFKFEKQRNIKIYKIFVFLKTDFKPVNKNFKNEKKSKKVK